ncbi:MAG: Mur ligase family protein, partial [Chryseobacterium sp.]
MQLIELLNRIPVLEIHGDNTREVSELVFDSRKVTENSLYIAMRGTVVDGHSFIASSIEKGAKSIICEEFPENLDENITYVKVKDSSKALGHLASNLYGNPSEKLKLIGVTGTNGKTSVSTLLFDVFKNLGYDSALLSTVEIRIGEKIIPATHTTPDVITINKILAQAVEEGCEFAFMEVSSHGISQNRIEGLHFKVAGFTNLTHDHLDYHKTFDEYLKTKKRFFDELQATAIAITNIDDKNG